MNQKRYVLAALILGIALWLMPSTAAAETEGKVNQLVWTISAQLLTIMDAMLGRFVEGNTLTIAGEDLVSSLTTLVNKSADVWAAFSSWLYSAPG